MKPPPQPIIDLLHKLDNPKSRIMMFCVPTRIFRVIDVDGSGHTFRVEQLVQHGTGNGTINGVWKTLSTHGSEVEGQSWKAAVGAAMEVQKKFVVKMQANMQKRQIVPARTM